MNVLSLFSGIGGIDLGLQRAGMTIVGQVEIDPWCRKILAKHWPEVPRHDDVRTAAEWWGDRAAPDVVAGGFPCQPVSSAGRRLAQDDPRWLWPAMAEVIRRLRPRYALMENVPGLLARGMGDVLGDLAACGYDAEWDCVPASAVGAPHRRDRVWIIAYPNGEGLDRGPELPAGRDALRRAGEVRAGADGRRLPVLADTGRPGGWLRAGRRQQQPEGSESPRCVAHPDSTAWPSPPRPAGQAVPGPSAIERPGRCASGGWGVWATEPDVGRVAHGIPARVDRLRGLGNAVVPQVVEHIGRLIIAAHQERAA